VRRWNWNPWLRARSTSKPLTLQDKERKGQTEISEHCIQNCHSVANYKIPSGTAFTAKPPNPTKTNGKMDAFSIKKRL
jgi:hypothetical protein